MQDGRVPCASSELQSCCNSTCEHTCQALCFGKRLRGVAEVVPFGCVSLGSLSNVFSGRLSLQPCCVGYLGPPRPEGGTSQWSRTGRKAVSSADMQPLECVYYSERAPSTKTARQVHEGCRGKAEKESYPEQQQTCLSRRLVGSPESDLGYWVESLHGDNTE